MRQGDAADFQRNAGFKFMRVPTVPNPHPAHVDDVTSGALSPARFLRERGYLENTKASPPIAGGSVRSSGVAGEACRGCHRRVLCPGT